MFFEAKALAFVMLGVLFTSSFTTGTSGEPAALEKETATKTAVSKAWIVFSNPQLSSPHCTHPSFQGQSNLEPMAEPDLSFEVVCKLCRIKSSKSKTVLPVAIGNVVETLAVFNHGHLCKSLLRGLLPLS